MDCTRCSTEQKRRTGPDCIWEANRCEPFVQSSCARDCAGCSDKASCGRNSRCHWGVADNQENIECTSTIYTSSCTSYTNERQYTTDWPELNCVWDGNNCKPSGWQ